MWGLNIRGLNITKDKVLLFFFISAMSELLFECYNVPSVAYGIDSLFSLYNNIPNSGKLKSFKQ